MTPSAPRRRLLGARPLGGARARAASATSFALLGVTFGAWTARLAEVKVTVGASPGELGLAFAAWSASALVSVPFAGGVVERLGSRRVFALAGCVFLGALVALAAAPGVATLAAAFALFGASGAFVDTAINAHGAHVEREYGRPIFSGLHALFSVGVLVGAGAAALAIWAGVGVLAFTAGVAVACLVAGAFAARAFLPEHGRHEQPPVFALPTRALAVPAALAFVALLAEDVANTWASVYAREAGGAGAATAAATIAVFAGGMVLARLVADSLVARAGTGTSVAASAVVCASGFAVAAVWPAPAAVVAGFALVGVGVGPLFPLALAVAGRRGTRGTAPGMAAASSVGSLGSLAGPFSVGAVGEAVSLPVALGAVAAVVAVAALLARGLR